METVDPAGKPRHRRLRRILVVAALLLSATPLLLNLALNSTPAKRWLAGKIRQRTGIEAVVSGVSLTPWHGLEFRGVTFLQPPSLRAAVKEPFLHSRSVRFRPVWLSLLRGKADVQAVSFDTPRIVIPLELLADLAKPRQPAAVQGPQLPPVPAHETPAPAVHPPEQAHVAPQARPTVAAVTHPTGWLHLSNASVAVHSATAGRRLFECTGLTGSVPIAGGGAQSRFTVGSLQLLEQRVLASTTLDLDWKPPFLTTVAREVEIAGLRVSIQGQTAFVPGLPLQVEANLPEQVCPDTELPGGHGFSAATVAANARFRGFLLAPGTWQGELIGSAKSPVGRVAGRTQSFDRGTCVLVMRGGVLSCPDARLVSDDLSLLGNATLLGDGRLAAVLRFVALPESAGAIASRLFPNVPDIKLTPLSTPQRAAFDLEAFGDLRQIHLRPGRDGLVLTLQR